MRTSTIITLFIIIALFSSCFPTDVRFVEAQPEHLKQLSIIPNKFKGKFVINKDTIIVTDCTINGDTINSDSLVIKSWGSYLFVNFIDNGLYKLGCAKVVGAFGNEDVFFEYFVLGDDDLISNIPDEFSNDEKELIWMEEVGKMIIDKSDPIIGIDTTKSYFILDNVNVNQFQSLLNNARSTEVIRIEEK